MTLVVNGENGEYEKTVIKLGTRTIREIPAGEEISIETLKEIKNEYGVGAVEVYVDGNEVTSEDFPIIAGTVQEITLKPIAKGF